MRSPRARRFRPVTNKVRSRVISTNSQTKGPDPTPGCCCEEYAYVVSHWLSPNCSLYSAPPPSRRMKSAVIDFRTTRVFNSRMVFPCFLVGCRTPPGPPLDIPEDGPGPWLLCLGARWLRHLLTGTPLRNGLLFHERTKEHLPRSLCLCVAWFSSYRVRSLVVGVPLKSTTFTTSMAQA